MISPVVSAQRDDTREDLVEMFTRYQFHLIPVVDEHDRLLGGSRVQIGGPTAAFVPVILLIVEKYGYVWKT